MRASGLLAVLAMAPLLAGCISCTPGPVVSARAVALDAPSDSGDGDAQLQILILDPTLHPISGAGVVVYWADDRTDGDHQELARAEAGTDGAQVRVGASAGTPAAASVLSLRTNGEGTALAHVPADRFIGVVAAAEGSTEEWIGHVASPAAGSTTTVKLTLYPEVVDFDLEGTLQPGGLSPAFALGSYYYWQPQTLPFEGSPTEFLARTVALNATLRWENQATSFGDLGLAVGKDGSFAKFQDDGRDMALGSRESSLRLDVDGLRQLGLQKAASLQVGAASESAFVSPFGLPFKLHVRLQLDRSAADVANCLYEGERGHPDQASAYSAAGPLAGLVLSLLGVAALRRRGP